MVQDVAAAARGAAGAAEPLLLHFWLGLAGVGGAAEVVPAVAAALNVVDAAVRGAAGAAGLQFWLRPAGVGEGAEVVPVAAAAVNVVDAAVRGASEAAELLLLLLALWLACVGIVALLIAVAGLRMAAWACAPRAVPMAMRSMRAACLSENSRASWVIRSMLAMATAGLEVKVRQRRSWTMRPPRQPRGRKKTG